VIHQAQVENIGWTLGNDCPFRCPHCYSTIVRNRGRNLTIRDINRIVGQLVSVGVKTVNLGGNEPLFTGGSDPKNTLLPYIIQSLYDAGIVVGLTTAGITLTYLEQKHKETVSLLNDVDISFDSPFAVEHNKNRGAALFDIALEALAICRKHGIDRTLIMCGMNWNLSEKHLAGLISLAIDNAALIRINFLKPIEEKHLGIMPTPEMFYRTCRLLFERCRAIEVGEPLASTMSGNTSRGCPCGTKSFRIHSITPEGCVPVSPCVYAHDFKTGDLLHDNLIDIINSAEFSAFRKRRFDPESIRDCAECEYIDKCRGGCTARAYLWHKLRGLDACLDTVRDPYCLREYGENGLCDAPEMTRQDAILVHRDYLCTLIVDPS
jgi:radical SAM protein with 4Fe4S-binding SPASM domain